MPVLPSTTGNDPVLEDVAYMDGINEETGLRSSIDDGAWDAPSPIDSHRTAPETSYEKEPKVQKLHREPTKTRKQAADERRRAREAELIKPPSLWNIYCAIITFWCPDFILRCFGKPAKAQQRAWREKMGLISIILMVMAFVGFLTFGFTATVCGTPPVRMKANAVDNGFLIIHGKAYNLVSSKHPAAIGVPNGANVLFDLPIKNGGRDASFLFQQVNGKCKGLINKAPGSDVVSDAQGNLGWYFPCQLFAQDGSTQPNKTEGPYLGYQCHTTPDARKAFYSLRSSGDVYFKWEDLNNSTRNLAVYSGTVLDLDLLKWFNASQVSVPSVFAKLSNTNDPLNQDIRGKDITHRLQAAGEKRLGECLEQIVKVGTIDTETVGCIASQVVLYVSLVFILSIVVSKFVLALYFQWFHSRRYAAAKTSQSSIKKKRDQQIEEWSDDIYRLPPRLPGDPGSTVAGSSNRDSRRGSTLFLPTTSRFTNPYAAQNEKGRPVTVTMSQSAGAHLLPPNPMYRGQNESRMSFPTATDDRSIGGVLSDISGESSGPSGFIHEMVVPQPPSDYQPFGFPLVHTLCLVTTYSEGEEGIRTTLDSIAMTDYPNSHKTILVICDGVVKGKGELMTTPDVCLSMMKDTQIPLDEVQPYSYVAVASGSKRHNMAKVYSGFYDYGAKSAIPLDKQQRVPMMVIVKCGTPDEELKAKPGNRGKRDSQIILMSFLQKVMFDERMTELEYEMFNGLWKITGISPDFFETVLCVDADTKIFPDSLTHMISCMVKDPEVMGLCGETKIANKRDSWVTAIQVFEYFISHHLSKSFESVFGGVTCLPGCFSMYRIKAPKGGANYWVPILANPDVVEHYSENVVDTLHKKNLLLLGEDRYLSTLMLRTFPKRKQVFVPQAVCKTMVPDKFMVLLSQRRRWINSTIHNLMELVLVRDLCGTFCFSMQFVVFIDLIGTLVLPAAIAFTFYVGKSSCPLSSYKKWDANHKKVIISIIHKPVQVIPLVLLALILGLPAVLIVLTAHRWSYVVWMFIYLISLPIWNFVLPVYAYWKFDDFSWGDTRKTAGEKTKKAGIEYEGEFDSSKITMKRWGEFERERRVRMQWPRGESKVAGVPGVGPQSDTFSMRERYGDDYYAADRAQEGAYV
jgi:chitin synthase